MKQPTITIKRLDLMGYTKETQMYFVQNGGGIKTFNFLKHWANRGAFERVQFMGQVHHGLTGERAERFANFASEQGFTIEWSAA